MIHFIDRRDAGKKLAEKLLAYAHAQNTIVLGLPRGGVITADEVAKILSLPLDCIVTRKLGAPFQPELSVGALTQQGIPLFNRQIMAELALHEDNLKDVIANEQHELDRRLALYRMGRPPLNLKNMTAIIVDDGIATGMTTLAAIESARSLGARAIIVASPVAPPDALSMLWGAVDKVICLDSPAFFLGISAFYDYFPQITDEEVINCLQNRQV